MTVSTSFKDSCVLFARLPTSVATTANPRPASPALAASIDAFNANKFVEEEMSLISFKVTPISCTASASFWAISVVAFMDWDTSPLIACKSFNNLSFSTDLSSKFLEVSSTFFTLSATTLSHSLNSLRFVILSSVLKPSMLLLSTSCSLVAASSWAEALSFSEICESDVPAVCNLSDNNWTEDKTLITCALFVSNSSFLAFTRKCETKKTKISNPARDNTSATRHIRMSVINNSSFTGKRSVPRIHHPINKEIIHARPLVNTSLISKKNAIRIKKKKRNPQKVLVGSIYKR